MKWGTLGLPNDLSSYYQPVHVIRVPLCCIFYIFLQYYSRKNRMVDKFAFSRVFKKQQQQQGINCSVDGLNGLLSRIGAAGCFTLTVVQCE